MCLIFTCGEHTFRKEVEGYEGLTCQCHNCGNYAGHAVKSNPWFTFCFIPVVPLSFHGYEDVVCSICNFAQPLEHRPDVHAMRRGAAPAGIPMQNQPPGPPKPGVPPPGWGQGPPGGQAPMRYG
ncbi:hypothetical protein GGS23DRAFT_554388 [Durotheca rogersii]|uniref:uncharacterized protein n=1 Tax=Durotheca rogersii TaxID=419775 RepID=UPI002221168C|nr:uncharacterized protein GGS23DRAFT_554388 [Durotheca rogersii]KAI5865869.1 hypothetical protein GGS23DRAFT_554388 [Durotheca rogersii]